MKKWFVYFLVDPRIGKVRYIGITCDPKRRLREHRNDAVNPKRKHWPVHYWITKLTAEGVTPKMILAEEVADVVDAGYRERELIALYRQSGARLLNLSDGGMISIPPTSRAQAGLKLRNRKVSPETRRKISAKKIGTRRPDLVSRNKTWLADRHRGRKMTLSEIERERRRQAALKLDGSRPSWTPERRIEFSQLQSERMKAVWAARRRNG
jgi:predicted GIY-YIG superfamily endonuclease